MCGITFCYLFTTFFTGNLLDWATTPACFLSFCSVFIQFLGQNWTFSGSGPTQKLLSRSLGMIYKGTSCVPSSKITLYQHPGSIDKNVQLLRYKKRLVLALWGHFQLDTSNKSWSKCCFYTSLNFARFSEDFRPISGIIWWHKLPIS